MSEPGPVIHVAFFSNKEDTIPQRRIMEWKQLCAILSKPDEREEKDGPLFSPVEYPANVTRLNANVRRIYCASMDFDHSVMTWDELIAATRGYAATIYTTYQHCEEDERYRVVMPLAEPVDAANWRDVWLRFNEMFNGVTDRSTKDPSRMHYLPACPPERKHLFKTITFTGPWISLDNLPPLPEPEPEPTGVIYQPEVHLNGCASRLEKWVRGGLRNEIENVLHTDTNKYFRVRNSAIALGGLVYTGYISEGEIFNGLYNAVESRAADKRKAMNGIRWGISQGVAQPRPIPEEVLAEREHLPELVVGEQYTEEEAEQAHVEHQKVTGHRHLTDLGNAERLVQRHGNVLRYVKKFDNWLFWDGTRWNPDDDMEIDRRATDTVRSIYATAASTEDDDVRKAMVAWARKSEGADRMRAMVSLSRQFITATPAMLDGDPWALNCANGVADLRTGKLLPHRQEDYHTKKVPVNFIPEAQCPQWLAFLHSIMSGNAGMVRWLQKAVGYALTGDTREHAMFILYGNGANGKSTFINILSYILAEYHCQCPTDTLMARDRSAPTNDLARLRGARMVSVSESDEGRRLAEGVVKQLTGGDPISCRFLNKEFFTYRPQFKIFMATNHRPGIRGTDHGIRRRIRMIPFLVQFWDEDKDETGPPERKMNKDLEKTLRSEAEGILAWCVEGCLIWQQEGLGFPTEVKEATEKYLDEQDPLNKFLEDYCYLEPEAEAPNQQLYQKYCQWCEENGETRWSQKNLTTRLQEKGFVQERTGLKGRFWVGIRIAPYKGEGEEFE